MFLLESIKFILFSTFIILISKYILSRYLRKFAEALNLNAKTIGNIAGIATSIPELLTITISTIRGLFSASLYNILSSNLINIIQYLTSIVLNKNISKLKNKAIRIDIILCGITILIPIIFLNLGVNLNMDIIPLFIILFIFFLFLNNNTHKLYLYKQENKIKNEKHKIKNRFRKIVKYFAILVMSSILLFIIGELLGNTIENLCNIFGVSEIIIGFLLGFITSIPELVTFFEAQKENSENDMLGVIEATNNLLTSNALNLFIIQTIGIFIINI